MIALTGLIAMAYAFVVWRFWRFKKSIFVWSFIGGSCWLLMFGFFSMIASFF